MKGKHRYTPLAPPVRKATTACNGRYAPKSKNGRVGTCRFPSSADREADDMLPSNANGNGSTDPLTILYHTQVKPLYKGGEKAEAVKLMVRETIKFGKKQTGQHVKQKVREKKAGLRKGWKHICKGVAKLGLGKKKDNGAEPQVNKASEALLPKMSQGFRAKAPAADADVNDTMPNFGYVQLATDSDAQTYRY